MSELIYIASPYSGTPEEMQDRFEAVERFTAEQMKAGLVVFSPIVHCHEIAAKYNMPTDFGFWQHYCLGMLEAADSFWVFMYDGWEKSKGVQGEIEHALKLDMEVHYVSV